MGFREILLENWEDKTIEYQGKKIYVIHQIVIEGQLYLYGINSEKTTNTEVEVIFLRKVKDDIFENIQEQKMIEELIEKMGVKSMQELIANDIEKLKKQRKNITF